MNFLTGQFVFFHLFSFDVIINDGVQTADLWLLEWQLYQLSQLQLPL